MAACRRSQIVWSEPPDLVAELDAELVQHRVQRELVHRRIAAQAGGSSGLPGRQHEGRAEGVGLELPEPADDRRAERDGEGAVVALGVRDHPLGAIQVDVLPLRAGELADAGAGRQKDLGRQGVLVADEGERRQDHPQLLLGELQTRARLPLAADRRDRDAGARIGDHGMAGDTVLEDLVGGGEDKLGDGKGSLPNDLDHRDDVGGRYVAGGQRPQPGQEVFLDVPPPVVNGALRHGGEGDGHVAGGQFPKRPGRRSLGVVGLLVAGDVLALLDLGAGCCRQLARSGEANVGVAPERQFPRLSAIAVAEHPGGRAFGRQGEG